MINITNLTHHKSGLMNLDGKYILAKKLDVSDVLIMEKEDFNTIEIPEQTYVVGFTNEPDKEIVESLSKMGIICFKCESSNILGNIKEYFDNGNIKNSYNFPDLDLGDNEKTRLSFVVKDMSDPITEILDMLSVLEIQTSKVKAVRRDDGISIVIVEIVLHEPLKIYFEGEIGSKILKYEVITK